MTARRQRNGDTATSVLDVAERLVQSRGFNAFSYADIAAELGITKAALHYHFAGKAELGEAILTRYTARFADALRAIDAGGAAAPEKLTAYAALYRDVLRLDRMCLCGILAAEYQTLPGGMQEIVLEFLNDNEAWLTSVLGQGEREGTLRIDGTAQQLARTIVATLEGAMLVARPFHDVARFEAAAAGLIASLATSESVTHP